MSSDIQDVAKPFKHLITINKTLKCIRKLTESQCKDARMGVMCSHRFFTGNRQAAGFCTTCSCCNDVWSRLTNKELQLFKRDVTKQ